MLVSLGIDTMIGITINNRENYSSVPQWVRRVIVHVLKVSAWENKMSAW